MNATLPVDRSATCSDSSKRRPALPAPARRLRRLLGLRVARQFRVRVDRAAPPASFDYDQPADFAEQSFGEARFGQKHVAADLMGALALRVPRARCQYNDRHPLRADVAAEPADQLD